MATLIDTNVLVYAVLPFDDRKHRISHQALRALQSGPAGSVSAQVLAEFVSAVSRAMADPTKQSWVCDEVLTLLRQWHVIPVDAAVVELAISLWERYSLSHWDAQILAAAVVGGCDTILTEDAPAPELVGVRYVNPFAEGFDPGALRG